MTSSVIEIPTTHQASQAGTQDPIHVAHVIEALGPGGAERLLHTNLKHFDPARVRSTVITVFSNADHWLQPISELGVEVVRLDCRSLRDLSRGVVRLRTWLRSARPDLIHTHLWAANVIGRIAGRLTGIPVISSAHNPEYEPEAKDGASGLSFQKLNFARTLDLWTVRLWCERIIAVSEYVRESTNRHLNFPLERVDLLYNPIDADLFRGQTSRDRDQVLGELGIPAESPILLNVARVSPQKGQLYAVRALPLIMKQYPDAHLLLAGPTTDPQWLARLEEEIRLLGIANQVHILGARSDVPDLLRACDIFIFPSLYEGLGIALIEAMAAGCVCVATNTRPLEEVVNNGVDGLLVPPRNEAALAEAVCGLLAAPARRASLAAEARASTLLRFQPQQAVDRLMGIYDSVVQSHKS